MSSQNKESSCMVKRVRSYCLTFTESRHMQDDGKICGRHTQCPLGIPFVNNPILTLRGIIQKSSSYYFKRNQSTKPVGERFQKGKIQVWLVLLYCFFWKYTCPVNSKFWLFVTLDYVIISAKIYHKFDLLPLHLHSYNILPVFYDSHLLCILIFYYIKPVHVGGIFVACFL